VISVSPLHAAPLTPVVPSVNVEPAVTYTLQLAVPLLEVLYGGHLPGPDMLPLDVVGVGVGVGITVGGGGDGEGGGGGDGEGGGEAVGVSVGVVHAPGVAMLTL
jgi:hypothetical protein